MSGFLPANTTLQLSNMTGDITHQGVLGSNASGSTLLTSTFPSTSTGTSLGHYHYTEATTNSLKFLNASGTGGGGHQFFHSSSTQSPFKTMEANRTGVITSTNFSVGTSTPILLPLPNIITSIDIALYTASSVQVSPYNMTPNNSVWPVQVNSDCTNMVTGVTYYAKVFNATTLQMNSNPDGGDTTIINAADLASRPQPILSLVTSSADESILTATDLTFNGTSLVTNVATNTSNIATNTSNIATNTSNIATNTSDINLLEVKQTNVLQVYSSPAIYADGRPPATVPTASSNTYANFGWYFKNTTAGYKINWYMPPATGMLVSDIIGLYLRFFNCATTSNDNSPFLTVLTTPTGNNDFFPGFFHSSMTYILDATPVINTSYTMFMNVTGTCPNPNSYASNLVPMEISPVSNPRGVYAPTDSVLAFVIGTNSASPVNSVEFIAQKLGVMTATGTQELLYQTLL